MQYARGLIQAQSLEEVEVPLDSPRNSLFVATINCKHRLPTDFANVHKLFQRG